MKNNTPFYAMLLIVATAFNLTAQKYWKGGFPGQETSWNHPRNWSDHRIPDQDSEVAIPDLSSHGNFYPVIDQETAPIASLQILSGAKLTITEKGTLTVDGQAAFSNGISLQGQLANYGVVKVRNVALEGIDGPPSNLIYGGLIIYESAVSRHLADKRR